MIFTIKVSVDSALRYVTIIFVGRLVFSRIPKWAIIASYFGFRKFKWILQIVSALRTWKRVTRIRLRFFGFRWLFADSTYNLGLRDSVVLLYINIVFSMRFHKLFRTPQNFAGFASSFLFRAILSNVLFYLFVCKVP